MNKKSIDTIVWGHCLLLVILLTAAGTWLCGENSRTNDKEDKYWFPNPNSTRLFIAPTGRMLKKGEAFISDIYLLLPGISYGISDRFTFEGGALLPPLGIPFLFYFTPKLAIKTGDLFNVCLGGLLVKLPRPFNESGQNSIMVSGLYVVGTYGTPNLSLTAGLGAGYSNDETGGPARPLIAMIGGEIRLSRRSSFVTENWIIPGMNHPTLSYGIRFFGKKFSVDLAFYNTIGNRNIFPGIPYVDFIIKL